MDLVRLKYIKEWISQLPQGNITHKTINGKKYPYYQWTENGKQRGRIVKEHELKELSEKIEQRKVLQERLKNAPTEILEDAHFFSSVKLGSELYNFVEPVKKYKKRECFQKLQNFVYGDTTDKVFILYGLRRTGKTTLIRQMIADMPQDMFMNTAFIQVNSSVDLVKINLDLKQLAKQGYKYVFIDEVTLMEDFIEGAALFSDIFATSGMKIVLSGTDSLGFMLSQSEQLYDRCFLLHTTFIPYREFENVLGIQGIDEYIRYGGTMSLSGINYNSQSAFANKKETANYVDSAIAHNIQHSLKYYQDGGHFRHLQDLYEKDELTSAINRVVEDINHRFTVEVLTKDFISNDLSISARNLRRDRNKPTDILDQIDRSAFIARLKQALEILDKKEQTVNIDESHAIEIQEYLKLLDLIYEIDKLSLPNVNDVKKITVISQPGMRYAQASALIDSLLLDEIFNELSLVERNEITKRILNEIRGRMMEDIILLETKIANPDKQVFQLQFAIGEFDMVICDTKAATCEIFEIKYSTELVKEHYKHLIDEEKCKATEHRFGTIQRKSVIYRGETQVFDDIQYINVEEYLRNLI